MGYGFEIYKVLISYRQKIEMKKIIVFAIDENKVSVKIVEKNNFKILIRFISDDLQLPETKYQLKL